MKRRWLRLTILGLAAFVAALGFQIPAGWALYLAQGQVPVDLQWQGASGSAFDAHVERLGVSFPGGRQAVVGPVRLRTHILPLVTGGAPFDFRIQSGFGKASGSGQIAWGEWGVSEVRGQLALAELPTLVPQLEAADLNGRVLFRGENLAGDFERGLPRTGNLRASVEDLRVGLIRTEKPLGDYALQMQAAGKDGFQGKVRTVNDEALLGIQGEVHADLPGGVVRFKGQGWAAPGAPQNVADILPLLGEVQDGRVKIDWQRKLP